MTKKEYLMIARAINKCKKVKPRLMFWQIPMEIAASIIKEDKSFDYHEFFAECNK